MDAHVVISREQAVAQGARYFFTGVPCYYGHIAPRYIVGRTSVCGECRRINSSIQADKKTERRRAMQPPKIKTPKQASPPRRQKPVAVPSRLELIAAAAAKVRMRRAA